ncbi:MAG: cytochrome c oxidase subunit II [Chloroflexi bacterium]|nr:cytochrome c oxidase subunit II [Chloroflexota bacterium]MCI0580125.1 cytochrome c oxidase subunit II [Chloroflexota bacterium]MCI0649299.1 cytochrome c oxidase subunit II [Chloroflexota bacterium]MCI0725968.1 cytochrome c oxidase subunit II [Chloroflexota bacterium]
MKSNRIHFAIVGLLIGLVSVGVYFLLVAIYPLPRAASAEAVPIDQMFTGHFMLIAFLFSVIVVFMLYSVIVFRRRPGDDEDAVHFHGHTGLEVAWTVIPTLIVLGFGLWAAVVLEDITNPNDNEMVVQVTGQQWSWSFAYPDHQEVGASGELVLPVNRPVRLEMQSRDVLHSFWVPEFRVKQDLVPGQTTILRITPTVIKEYTVSCAEICGTRHAFMQAAVRVVSQADFEAWLAERAAVPPVASLSPEERGQMWYTEFGCSGCHTLDGTGTTAPSWLGLFGSERTFEDGSTAVADEAYIRESIINPGVHIVDGFPPGVMPPDFERRIEDREAQIQSREGMEIDIIADIIAFMMTLEE